MKQFCLSCSNPYLEPTRTGHWR